ncbi:unnamed protein product [Orchesella dallaii]|uniref:Cation/H+ exchanger transmembrane domain-containing protein n=1 Tax=Orchesella dallaii TaxID=48710 RepID=A0ABP1PQB2_9HEXA
MEVEATSEGSISSKSPGNNRSIINLITKWTPPLWLEKLVISFSVPVLIWMVTYLWVGVDGLPGGQIFALIVLLFFGIATGYAVELVRFPPLLGMLIVGMAIRNVPGIKFAVDLTGDVSSTLRQTALVVILIRAGLGLDPTALAKLSGVVIRLAFGPCLMEAVTIAVASHFILDFPWSWGLLLGFVLAAVSPAVTVPCLLSLRDQGYGIAKGIPTIVIAAASVDDILAISAFGVALGFAFNQDESLTMTIIQGPIELVLGITFGVLWGLGLGIFLSQPEDANKDATLFRIVFLLFGGCLSVFGFQYVNFAGSGALGCLTAAFVASILWRRKGILSDNDNLNWGFQKLWFVFQPLLFGLIGCEIDFSTLDPSIVLLGLLCLVIALAVRITTSFYMVARSGLTLKERIFIAMAWLPKATVQAAIGPVAYDLARQQGAGASAEKLGLEVLTIAVLSILVTAPIGAVAIMLFGPKLLSKDTEIISGESKNLTAADTFETESKHEVEAICSNNGEGDLKVNDTEMAIRMSSVNIDIPETLTGSN